MKIGRDLSTGHWLESRGKRAILGLSGDSVLEGPVSWLSCYAQRGEPAGSGSHLAPPTC